MSMNEIWWNTATLLHLYYLWLPLSRQQNWHQLLTFVIIVTHTLWSTKPKIFLWIFYSRSLQSWVWVIGARWGWQYPGGRDKNGLWRFRLRGYHYLCLQSVGKIEAGAYHRPPRWGVKTHTDQRDSVWCVTVWEYRKRIWEYRKV